MPLVDNWKEEMQSAWLYRVIAGIESDPAKTALFRGLADGAEAQARVWADKMRQQGEPVPVGITPSLRMRIVAHIVRRFGPKRTKPMLIAMKVRGMSIYSGSGLRLGHPLPTSVEEIGQRHKGVEHGGNLRAAVFGINDGLVSNASLIMGVAGATAQSSIILITGVAGMLAGALSMAAGEYVSVRSQRELFEYQIGLEREELEHYPEEEAEELALIYNARGLPMEQARDMAGNLIRDPEKALDTLAREELGLNPDDLGSPWGAALSSFTAFSAGSMVPILPFLFAPGATPIIAAALLTAASLFIVGAVLSLFTGKGAVFSGLRMVLVGGTAGVVTYSIGRLLGISLT
jgi:VIT1/CCC1 family predicted Fe2+/Mn2+ transporter